MSFFEVIYSKNLKQEQKDWFGLALEEARKGLGFTHPNPPVGCVIVKEDRLIASGYHQQAGQDHAEVVALKKAGEEARGATLYVTLEPCNHTGRTPPCTQAIIRAGIKKVVYGASDPNPHVPGLGALRLKDAGIQVEYVADPKKQAWARALILPFSKLSQEKRPYILGKIASSLDGKIAFKKGERTHITSDETQRRVHELREACDAIMIGSNTVLVDNPELTARFKDRKAVRQPIRIILDSRLRTDPKSRVYAQDKTNSNPNSNSNSNSYVVYGPRASKSRLKAFEQAGITCILNKNKRNMRALLEDLGALGIGHILLEGGAEVLTSFLQQNLLDELAWFTAPVILGDQGVSAVGKLSKALKLNTISSCQTAEFLSKDRLWLISSIS